MDPIIFLHAFTIINKCLLFPLFWFKRNNSIANRMLALLILLPAVPVIVDYLIYTEEIQRFPNILFIYQPFINLFGPVYYFYCMVMIGKEFKFNKSKLLHLLPSVFPLFLWLDFHALSQQEQHDYISFFLDREYLNWKMAAVSITPVLFALPYMFTAAWKVYRHLSSEKSIFTNLETSKINYIREFINITIFEILLLVSLYAFLPVKQIEIIWIPIFGNAMYFYIIYKSYNYSVIFSETDYKTYQKLHLPINDYVLKDKIKKYANSSLSVQKMNEYADMLTAGFEEQQWHLDPEMSLNLLSEKSNIPAHYISQTINQKFKRNFFDYINSCRVEELKVMLIDSDYQHIKLEELAYMCGFNSKAAFQRAFKKHTKMTPTEYRDSHKELMMTNI